MLKSLRGLLGAGAVAALVAGIAAPGLAAAPGTTGPALDHKAPASAIMPARLVWVPGHWRWHHGERFWIRGHYVRVWDHHWHHRWHHWHHHDWDRD